MKSDTNYKVSVVYDEVDGGCVYANADGVDVVINYVPSLLYLIENSIEKKEFFLCQPDCYIFRELMEEVASYAAQSIIITFPDETELVIAPSTVDDSVEVELLAHHNCVQEGAYKSAITSEVKPEFEVLTLDKVFDFRSFDELLVASDNWKHFNYEQ